MNKTVKMLIGITAGLALLLGPTAVYAGKGNNNKEKGRGDQKIKVESEREKKIEDNDFRAEDSFQDNSRTRRDTYNQDCSDGIDVNLLGDDSCGNVNRGGDGDEDEGEGEADNEGLLAALGDLLRDL